MIWKQQPLIRIAALLCLAFGPACGMREAGNGPAVEAPTPPPAPEPPASVSVQVNGQEITAAGDNGYRESKIAVEKTFKADKVQMLQVKGDVGEISVKAGEPGEEKILIRVEKRAVGGSSPEERKSWLERLQTTAALQDKTLVVETHLKGEAPHGISVAVSRYTITVPKRLRLDLKTETGGIRVAGVQGGAHLASGTGAVELENTGGALEVSSETGAVSLTLPHSASATVTAHSETGAISLLNNDPQTPDETEANSDNRDLHTQKITLGTGKDAIHLKTQTGSISVNLR